MQNEKYCKISINPGDYTNKCRNENTYNKSTNLAKALTLQTEHTDDDGFILDSWETDHVVSQCLHFKNYNKLTQQYIWVWNGAKLLLIGKWSVTISNTTITLQNVLHVTTIIDDLIFVPQLTKNGRQVTFNHNSAVITPDNETYSPVLTNNLYHINACIRLEHIIKALAIHPLKNWHTRSNKQTEKYVMNLIKRRKSSGNVVTTGIQVFYKLSTRSSSAP